MSSPDYFNGPAITQYSEDSFITHCLVSCFLLLCVLPLITYFKNSIWQTFVCIENIIKCTYFYIAYIFETSYILYIIWKEIKQLQPQNQYHQQVKTGNSLLILLIIITPLRKVTEYIASTLHILRKLQNRDTVLTIAQHQV